MLELMLAAPFGLFLFAAIAQNRGGKVPLNIVFVPVAATLFALSFLPALPPTTINLGIPVELEATSWGLVLFRLVTGIGALVFLYAGTYLSEEKQKSFWVPMGVFFLGMIGLSLAQNLLGIFLFWELTSISSFLLIGLDSKSDEAKLAARRALLITGAGALAMLAGILLWEHSSGASNEIATWAILLILFGCMTKSALFPFHFWLPGAMAAPTPVSAYLHSATMVKAGVFLIIKLHPMFRVSEWWSHVLLFSGVITFLLGSTRAFWAQDLKRLLAMTTVATLGLIAFLVGVDTEVSFRAAILVLVSHAAYKGTLFLVAGNIDHEANTRDLDKLGGLRNKMPWTCAAAVLAGVSMIGLPFTGGFLAKEWALLSSIGDSAAVLWALILGYVFLGASVLRLVVGVFFVKPKEVVSAHEAPWPMVFPPLVLSLCAVGGYFFFKSGTLFGVGTEFFGISAPKDVLAGHGPGVRELVWSGSIVFLSIIVFLFRKGFQSFRATEAIAERWGGRAVFEGALALFVVLADFASRVMSRDIGPRQVIRMVLLSMVAMFAWSLYKDQVWLMFSDFGSLKILGGAPGWFWIDLVIVSFVMVAAVAATQTSSILAALTEMGVIGLATTLIFVFFGAPDLALTQLLVEVLSVLLFVLVVRRYRVSGLTGSRIGNGVNVLISVSVGLCFFAFVILGNVVQHAPSITSYFAERSYTMAFGRNVVNVILIDFRAFDTLGEITVLGIAAISVYALLRKRPREIQG